MSTTQTVSTSPRGLDPADDPTRTRARRRRWLAEVGWKYPFAAVMVFYAGFPLAYVLSAAFAPTGTLTGSTQLFRAFSTANFQALDATRFWTWMANSLVISTATAVGAVLMGAAAAYAFSRFGFRGRRAGLTSLLIIQMFPQMLAFVAIFLLLLTLGNAFPALGLNSRLALICVYLGGALGTNTFLMYGFFNTIPREIDEAARIDGATHAQIYWLIVLRLVTPILAVVALLSFIATFGEFILARIILTSESNWTLAVGMFAWVSDQLNANWGLFAAGAVVAALPILLLFLFLQKYIVGGLTAGSVKG
jgi:arabinogalactan oligomer / maltooligosaccharide transport system permease protein